MNWRELKEIKAEVSKILLEKGVSEYNIRHAQADIDIYGKILGVKTPNSGYITIEITLDRELVLSAKKASYAYKSVESIAEVQEWLAWAKTQEGFERTINEVLRSMRNVTFEDNI